MNLLPTLAFSTIVFPGLLMGDGEVQIEIWHGENQRVGHLGDAQDDFNVLGHINNWQAVERLQWRVNRRGGSPMHFHAYRRLVENGDFNADIPTAWLEPGENTITIQATLRDGAMVEESISVVREVGESPLPYSIDWAEVENPQQAGQYVDGRWRKTSDGLRTDQVGYDRVFMIGERDWKDYEVLTSITVHDVARETTPISGGNGVGIIWRFAGHVVGGHRDFPSGQPKWGYQPFGAIGWLRWQRQDGYLHPPFLQFYPGDGDRVTDYGRYEPGRHISQSIRMRCVTLPDTDDGKGVTQYSFKVWPTGEPEPSDWTWSHTQTSLHALRTGGIALVAHHVDVTFGDIHVIPILLTD